MRSPFDHYTGLGRVQKMGRKFSNPQNIGQRNHGSKNKGYFAMETNSIFTYM